MTLRPRLPSLSLFLVAATLYLSGCAQPSTAAPASAPMPAPALATVTPTPSRPAPATPTTPADQSLARLRAAIGQAGCDTDAQCRTVPIGHRPCGGPQAYLAWSTREADAGTVLRLADAYTEARRAATPADRMSICSVVPDPGAACMPDGGARRCALLQPSRAPVVR